MQSFYDPNRNKVIGAKYSRRLWQLHHCLIGEFISTLFVKCPIINQFIFTETGFR